MDFYLTSNSKIIGQGYSIWSRSPLWDSRQTDLTLILDSWKFNAHKDVLEKSSDYFKAMFSSQMIESVKDVIELHLVNPEDFKVLIEGMYTGSLELSEDNVFGVAQAIQMFQITQSLRSRCIDFMMHNLINLQHCLELLYFCIPLNIQELYSDVRKFCLAHFLDLRHSHSFLKLSLAELYDYLSDKHLVVEEEVHLVEAIHKWLNINKNSQQIKHENGTFKVQIKKLISSCVYVKDIAGAHDIIIDAVLDECLSKEKFQFALAKRPRQEDVFLLWSLLKTSDPSDGLIDVVKLCLDTGNGIKFDNMSDVVKKPGFNLGSALCALGPCVYLSGGGPEFGKTNWIRNIWKFDISQPSSRWSIVGNLIDFRRSHAMVILKNKLYIFGGFGKFRTKNCQLDSLDLVTGTWENLPPMPVHELNLATTVYDDKIFYISTDWVMYSYCPSAKEWTTLGLCNTEPHRSPVEPPLALFHLKTEDINCFIVLTVTDICLVIRLLDIDEKTMKLYTNEQNVATFNNSFIYAGSVIVNGNLAIFLTCEKMEECMSGEHKASYLQKVVTFDPQRKHFYDLPAVQNVVKALDFFTLPYLPSTSKITSLDFT